MNEEEYKKYKETKQELPADVMIEEDEEAEDEENKPRRHIRYYKRHEVMLQECERYVLDGKRLPKLHSRWIVNRYVNEHRFTLQSVPQHNRMVDDLREANREVIKLRRRVQELEAMSDGNE
jgi:hypothetical protein